MMRLLNDKTVQKIYEKTSELAHKGVKLLVENINFVANNYTFIESHIVHMIEFSFGPKQIFYYILIVIGLQSNAMLFDGVKDVLKTCFSMLNAKGRKKMQLTASLNNAKTYQEWQNIASELDQLLGFDEWRMIDVSNLYDYRILRKRILDTIQMINQGDMFNLMFRMRGGLARDQFGILHEALFTKAMAGTKNIIEDYHDTVNRALDFICDSPIADDEIPTDAKLAFFNETRHAYGRTALILSGGAYLGYYHAGLARALWKEGLMPRVISGASAGSLTAICLGVCTNDELDGFLSGPQDRFRLDYLKQDDKIHSKIGHKIQKLIPKPFRFMVNPLLSMIFDNRINLIDQAHFVEVLKHNVGSMTFQEAFDRSGRIINVTVAPSNDYDPPRLLNYLTAPHVCLWSAAAASCAIPGVFDSSMLYVKETNGMTRPEHEWSRAVFLDPRGDVTHPSAHVYTDGSFDADLPMQQLSELFNVNHFIISQANIHSGLLTSLLIPPGASKWFRLILSYMRFLKAHVRDWFKNIIALITHHSDLPHWGVKRGLIQALLQDHEGREKDITIMPWKGHVGIFRATLSLLKSHQEDEFQDILDAGESRTWPYLARIKAHCSVEQTLDRCVQRLRKRLTEQSLQRRHFVKNSTSHKLADGSHSNGGSKIDGSSNFTCPTCNCNISLVRSKSTKDNDKQMCRVPSFYTSRSILNLSGLSVVDNDANGTHTLYSSRRKSTSSNADSRSGSNSNNDIINESERIKPELKLPSTSRLGSSPSSSPLVKNTASVSDSNLVLYSTATTSTSALGGAGATTTGGGSSNASLSHSRHTNESAGEEDDSDAADNLLNTSQSNVQDIFKTTRMSNFYYKRSLSEEALQYLSIRGSTQLVERKITSEL